MNGTKSLPSPRKLDFEPNGATDQHTPKKTGITSTNGTEKTETLKGKQGTLAQEDVDHYYKIQDCIPLPQEHPDAYGKGPLKEFGGNPVRKYRTLQRAKGLYRVADMGIYGND